MGKSLRRLLRVLERDACIIVGIRWATPPQLMLEAFVLQIRGPRLQTVPIHHGKSIVTLRQELEREITWARGELEKHRRSDVKVTIQSMYGWGGLERSRFFANGKIDFAIDLENTSEDRAISIHAIYFYSTDQWTLYQDGKMCALTSAGPHFVARGFRRKQFLQPPLQILQKGSWAQLKFDARGTLGTSFKGEQLQDSYHVRGISALRIVTADGNFDYDIPIDVEVNEIPF